MSKKNRLIHFDSFHIVPGYKCNLTCDHCATNSGPNEKLELSNVELVEIKNYIKDFCPSTIAFTGGEPFLYTDLINTVLSYYQNLNDINVRITTNGYFSTSLKNIQKSINKISKISCLQISFDYFHGNRIKREDLRDVEKNKSPKTLVN